MNYYNEIDPKAAQWLRELIASDLIPKGEVDERSIADVAPSDLKGFIQCHFFAGIGGWPYALRLAGWPEDREVWTGSCPCQPFSIAGKGQGTEDDRHLWPAFRWLIAKRRPSVVFGEQVASKDGRAWLSGVRFDLEAMGYRCGAADLCAASCSAPHIRQRLWWVAKSEYAKRWKVNTARDKQYRNNSGRKKTPSGPSACGTVDSGLADNPGIRRYQGRERVASKKLHGVDGDGGKCCGLENTSSRGRITRRAESEGQQRGTEFDENRTLCSGNHNPWADSVFIPCSDGKWRRVPARRGGGDCGVSDAQNANRGSGINSQKKGIGKDGIGWRGSSGSGDGIRQEWQIEPALFSVVDGLSERLDRCIFEIDIEKFPLTEPTKGRVALLKGYGNAIVPTVGAMFVMSYLDIS